MSGGSTTTRRVGWGSRRGVLLLGAILLGLLVPGGAGAQAGTPGTAPAPSDDDDLPAAPSASSLIHNEVKHVAHKTGALIAHLNTYKSNLEAAEESQKKAVAAAIGVDMARADGDMKQAFKQHAEEVSEQTATETAEVRAAQDEQIALHKRVQAGSLTKTEAKQRMFAVDAQVELKVAEAATVEANKLHALASKALAALRNTPGASAAALKRAKLREQATKVTLLTEKSNAVSAAAAVHRVKRAVAALPIARAAVRRSQLVVAAAKRKEVLAQAANQKAQDALDTTRAKNLMKFDPAKEQSAVEKALALTQAEQDASDAVEVAEKQLAGEAQKQADEEQVLAHVTDQAQGAKAAAIDEEIAEKDTQEEQAAENSAMEAESERMDALVVEQQTMGDEVVKTDINKDMSSTMPLRGNHGAVQNALFMVACIFFPMLTFLGLWCACHGFDTGQTEGVQLADYSRVKSGPAGGGAPATGGAGNYQDGGDGEDMPAV